MRINIDLNTDDTADLVALRALIGSFGGDKMGAVPTAPVELMPVVADPNAAMQPVDFVPPPPGTDASGESMIAEPDGPAPLVSSDELLRMEAERAQAPANGVPPELDSSGLPYDARIHSSTRARNNDQTWRNKRGVDKDLLASVTAELRASAAPAGPTPIPPPPALVEAPEPPALSVAALDAPSAVTYATVVAIAGERGLVYDQLNQLAATFGLATFSELNKRPELFEAFIAALPAAAPAGE